MSPTRLRSGLLALSLGLGGALFAGSSTARADTCTGLGHTVTGGVSFEVAGEYNRQWMTGADIEWCSDGTFIVHVYPGWASKDWISPTTSADVVLQEVEQFVENMDDRTRQSIWDQAFCHALNPFQDSDPALATWDLEGWRGPAPDTATMIQSECSWYNP